MSDIDSYLKKVTPAQKLVLGSIRETIKNMVPEAEEVISYGIPAFKLGGKDLLYFAAFKRHMSLYPASDEMISEVGRDLAKFRTSTGTLQFTEANPIPDEIIRKIIQFRLSVILNN